MKLISLFLIAQFIGAPNSGFWSSSKEFEKQKLYERAFDLEKRLNEVVIGQVEAVKTTADAIIRYAAGINDPKKPIATLLYCGPTGVGKTELAKQLAIALYDDPNRFIFFNMSEFSGIDSTRLIGSCPGYVDSDKGGQLTNVLAANPYSVVLFDEIEKANPQVRKTLLKLFDEGTITSAMGVEVDAHACIFILTSNIESIKIARLAQMGHNCEQILEEIKPTLIKQLSPEFYNRLEPVVFQPLSEEVVISIIHKMLNQLSQRIADLRQIQLEFDQNIVDYLLVKGFDPLLGARPLERLIEKELTSKLAIELIRGKFKRGDRLLMFRENGEFVLTKY